MKDRQQKEIETYNNWLYTVTDNLMAMICLFIILMIMIYYSMTQLLLYFDNTNTFRASVIAKRGITSWTLAFSSSSID